MRAAPRSVRVFISSTFLDMQAERDYLVRHALPRLRNALAEYHILIDEVDLRWGVSREQSADRRELEVCLDEVDQCRPFFVGLIGDRYGWIPPGFEPSALGRFPWLAEASGKSITELEILHGVFREPRRHPALFFFRRPGLADRLPESRRAAFVDRDAEAAQKLHALTERIWAAEGAAGTHITVYDCDYAGFRIDRYLARLELPPEEWEGLDRAAPAGRVSPRAYAALDEPSRNLVDRFGVVALDGLEELATQFVNQLLGVIGAELGVTDADRIQNERDTLAAEAARHEWLAASRLRAFVGRGDALRALADYADGDDTGPCLVSGEAGIGKSALLARFAEEQGRRHPERLVIVHFLGASVEAGNHRLFLTRFCHAIGDYVGPAAGEIPPDPFATSFFAETIARVPAGRRVVIVFDGVNQLEQTRPPIGLRWLPDPLPPNVKVICSYAGAGEDALPDLASRRGRGREIRLGPLPLADRRALLETVPMLSAKTLDEAHVRELLDNPASANPLFLLTVLDEVRGLRSARQVADYLRRLPREGDPLRVVYGRVMDRLEFDLPGGLVPSFFRFVAAAPFGLPVTDLIRLCQWDSGRPRCLDPVGGYLWVDDDIRDTLFEAFFRLRHYFFELGRYLCPYHAGFVEAIRERYLPTEEDRSRTHGTIADFFSSQQLTATAGLGDAEFLAGQQSAEVPWHLEAAGRWDELASRLADVRFLVGAWVRHEWDLLWSWARIEEHSELRLIEAYRPVLQEPGRYRLAELQVVAELLEGAGLQADAERLRRDIRSEYERRGETPGMKAALVEIFDSSPDPTRREARDRTRNRAFERRRRGQESLAGLDFRGAEAAFREAEEAFRALNKEDEALGCMGGWIDALRKQGKGQEALAVACRYERCAREVGDIGHLTESLLQRAWIHGEIGQSPEAGPLLDEAERLGRQWGNRRTLPRSLLVRCHLAERGGRHGEAASLAEQADRAFFDLGEVEVALRLRIEGAAGRAAWGEPLEQVVASLEEAERLAERGDLPGVAKESRDARAKVQAYTASAAPVYGPLTVGSAVIGAGAVACWYGYWWTGGTLVALASVVTATLGVALTSRAGPCPTCGQPALSWNRGKWWMCAHCRRRDGDTPRG